MEAKVEKIYPLTPLQGGMLAFTKLYGDSMYIVQKRIPLEGEINKNAIDEALAYLVDRYEVLRTFFVTVGVKAPVQAVLKNRKILPEYIDISQKSTEEQEQFLEDYLSSTRKKGFDLARDPLFRFAVVKIGDRKYELLWTLHHIILDGWSTGILLSDFINIYTDICCGRKVQTSIRNEFSTYVNWLKSKDKKDLEFWKDYLADYKNILSVEGKDLSTGSFNYSPRELSLFIDGSLGEGINNLAKTLGVTVNLLFETIWGLMLQKSNYTDDVVFGYVSSGRNVPVDGIENMVGLTINTIPIRVNTDEADSFKTLAIRMQENYGKLQQYEYSSLVEIQSGTELKNNLINHIMVFENYPYDESINSEEAVKNRGFKILGVAGNEQTNYDLNVVVIPGSDALELKFMYNSGVFTAENVRAIKERFLLIMEQVITNPDISCKDINICFSEEKEKLLKWSVNHECGYPTDKAIQDIFREVVEEYPDRIAVQIGEEAITYKELDTKSDLLTVKLKKLGVKADCLVGLCIEKSIELIIGMFAILKAGGAYIPMDPDYPIDRINYMIEKAGATLVLVNDKFDTAKLEGVTPVNVCEETNASDAEIQNIKALKSAPTDAAYVIFTSGTTGNPKGVLIPHRNVVRLLFNDRFQFDFSENDVWTMFHSACFDFSVWEIYGALLYGGKLILVPKSVAKAPKSFAKLLEEEKVTVLNQVPSSLYNLIQFVEKPLPALRYLVTGGEALNPTKTIEFKKDNPYLRIINMYGITETTVHTTYKEILEADAASELSNIGKPLPTLDTYIMNGDNLCGIGIVGEICVAGAGLARGYVNLPELTAERFVESKLLGTRIYRSGDLGRWLENGEIEYLGRADQQVKIRGFRIELKEIETVLLQQPGVADAVVIVKTSSAGDKQLCAFIVGEASDYEMLKNNLKKRLPDYMVPTSYCNIETIPVTKNGKVDKGALEAIDLGKNLEYVAPETEIEKSICSYMEEILHTEKIGATDNFFVRGGHSLSATILEAKIAQMLKVNIPLAKIFSEPTPRQIAKNVEALLSQKNADNNENTIEALGEREFYPLSYNQQNLWSTVSMGNDNGTLNIVSAFILRNIHTECFEQTIRGLVEKHEALRTRIKLVEGVPVQYFSSTDEIMQEYKCEDFVDKDVNIEEIVDKEYETPFDLLKDSLVRFQLIQTGENEHLFILTLHHIIADAWSFDVLSKDMLRLYESYLSGSAPEIKKQNIRYVDFAAWQKKELQKNKDALKTYWSENLKNPIPVLNMNTDFKRPIEKEVVGAGIDIDFDKQLVQKLQAYANEKQVSVFMVTLSAVYLLLNMYSGQKDIIIGTPIAGRDNPKLKDLVGYFLNILPLRVNQEGCESVDDLLSKVKTTTIEAYNHQDYPFAMMVEDKYIKRDPSRAPFFDVMVQQINTAEQKLVQMDDAEIEVVNFKSKQSKYDLVFNFLQTNDGYSLRLEYSTKLFKPQTVERLLERYQLILSRIVENVYTNLADIKEDL